MKPAEIVLVEDNPADVMLVEMALKENGIAYRLTKFEDGQAAVQALCEPPADNQPVPDAILLDLNTPRTDGFEALRSLKEAPRLSGVPITVFTSSRAQRDRQRVIRQGARYVEKPSALAEFLAAVAKAVRDMLESPGPGAAEPRLT